MATAKSNLYSLIEQLPESAVKAAEKLLQVLIAEFPTDNPKAKIQAMLASAPVDDEPISQLERDEIVESCKRISGGEGITLDDLKKELGL